MEYSLMVDGKDRSPNHGVIQSAFHYYFGSSSSPYFKPPQAQYHRQFDADLGLAVSTLFPSHQ